MRKLRGDVDERQGLTAAQYDSASHSGSTVAQAYLDAIDSCPTDGITAVGRGAGGVQAGISHTLRRLRGRVR